MLPHLGFKRGLQKTFRKMNDFGAPGEGGGVPAGDVTLCEFMMFFSGGGSIIPLSHPPPKEDRDIQTEIDGKQNW